MSKLKLGWAVRDMSTNDPINLPGQFHMRISQGVSDPVLATALVVDGGDDYVIFLSCDIVVIRCGLLDETRAAVARKNPEIDPLKIIMNATHTHTGPSTYHDNTELKTSNISTVEKDSIPDVGIKIASSDAYRAVYVDKASDAVCEAWAKRSEGKIAYGYGFAVASQSRRTVYFDDVSERPGSVKSGYMVDGHAKMYGNTNDPMFSGYEAGADHFINIMYTFDANEKLTGAVVNVPCPSQNSEQEYKLSADYWHDTRERIREKYGDIFILPQCAAAGDLSPRILHYREAQNRRFRLKYGSIPTERAARRDIAERITDAFGEVLGWAKKELIDDAKVTHVTRTIELSRRLITDDEYEFAKKGLAGLAGQTFKTEGRNPVELMKYNSSLQAQRGRFERIIYRWELQKTSPKLPTELHVLRIGNIAFATNRFELYMDFMHRIQARSPFEQTFVIQLAGVPGEDGGTYLATAKGAVNKGYSACLFCNQVSPEGGQELVEETLKTLNEIK